MIYDFLAYVVVEKDLKGNARGLEKCHNQTWHFSREEAEDELNEMGEIARHFMVEPVIIRSAEPEEL